MILPVDSLTDAEAAEDLAEQIVGAELPGYLRQRELRLAEVFGQ